MEFVRSHNLPCRTTWTGTMKLTHIRNATILIEFESAGQHIGLLVHPMLSQRGALPSLRFLGARRPRNPLVDLPAAWQALSKSVTHGLITHCQRGHFCCERVDYGPGDCQPSGGTRPLYPTTGNRLVSDATRAGLAHRLLVPHDGQTFEFPA